ncbi:MAG: aminodeoxychorismate synthase component I [Alphaproteobacteria bacterium]|nr:aminodeoxychorismate synthase component I [Alphaproteobacteria bacterium]
MPAIDLRNAPLVLLDDSRPPHRAGRSLLFHSPEAIISAHKLEDVQPALEQMDQAVADGLHVAGWIAYECAAYFEPRLAPLITELPEEPLIWMIATRHREAIQSQALVDAFQQAQHGNFHYSGLTIGQSAVSKDDYLAALEQIHRYIQAGDVYQINHTFPIPCTLKGDSLALYEELRASQPVPYGAYIDTGTAEGFKVLSLSPELFVRREGDQLMGKPMKGTAPRGLTAQDDKAAASALQTDEKSRAENLMIVDLIRNDLSRIASPGSVSVPYLYEVESYPTLLQMTSTVSAQAPQDLSPSRLLKALFPCGSVTGAPKVRAMEVIQELEQAPRGVYCGAIGHFSRGAQGKADWSLNVPIRTLVLDGTGNGRLSVGSGVVADSDATGEYEECLLKARFAKSRHDVFSLIETLKLDSDKRYHMLDLHLARLAESAAYFDFSYNEAEILAMLDEHASAFDTSEIRRVRLLLAQSGAITISSTALPAASETTVRVCIANDVLPRDNVFLRHKTTNRQRYDGAFAKGQKAGFDDILFFNDRGELTEGAISNVFLVKDGKWFTPALECGLLPGVLRTHLLKTHSPAITEKILTRSDLLAADELYIGNSLRGLRKARLDLD